MGGVDLMATNEEDVQDKTPDEDARERFVWKPGDIRIVRSAEEVQEQARRELEELNP